jgi:hypothetical protein
MTMIAAVVSVVALAGTAMAACPISVDIVGATDHVAQISVTNTGSEIITIFKGNTVLSDHATKDLIVTDAGMPVAYAQPLPSLTPSNSR